MPAPIIATVCILAVCVLVCVPMWLGWRHRQRTQATFGQPQRMPEGLAAPRMAVDDALYVATTLAGHPLERVTVPPLAYPSRADVEVHASGIGLGIAGADPVWLPLDQLIAVGVAQGAIDRAVEPGGLVAVRWQLDPEHAVETYLRVVDPVERAGLLRELSNLVAPASSEYREDVQ